MMVQGKIIKRLLGQPTNDHSTDPNSSFETRPNPSLLRPTSSQTATFTAGYPLTCLDNSPIENFAIIAGEKVFKTIKIDGSTILEQNDLRAALSTHASNHKDISSASNDQLNIKTVKWAHGELDTSVITASANGRITLYDLNRLGSGFEVGRIREHARQVHKLAINPYRAALLLSASQDGTARLFDIKAPTGRSGLTFHSRTVFKTNADPVRDIKWSPNAGFEFACSTASGSVQHWDTRKPSAPVMKINAHDSACLSISWHPDGQHLVSGGFDNRCYVWDLSTNAEKRQKPKYSFATPAPVSIVSWRPALWSTSVQAHRAAQVAVVYDDTNSMKTQNSTLHIWDFARPSMPFKEIAKFESSPTGLLWQQRDFLWTVSRLGDFTQTDVAFAPKVIDRRSLSAFDISPSGEIVMLLEERQGRRLASTTTTSDIASRSRNSGNHQQTFDGQLSISHSDSEEDVGGSFLGPKILQRKQGRRHSSTRSSNSLSTTPPSAPGPSDVNLLKFDEGVNITGLYKPRQVMAIGQAPAAAKKNVFHYLSTRYLFRIIRDIREAQTNGPLGSALHERLESIMEYFAKSSEGVSHFRMAQTWRMLSFTMGLLLTRRAHYHRDERLLRVEKRIILQGKQEKQELKNIQRNADQLLLDEMTPRRAFRPRSPLESLIHPSTKSIIAEEFESTSNVTTPLARPMNDSLILDAAATKISTIENDVLSLPPAVHSPSPGKKADQSGQPVQDSFSSEEGYDFYDLGSVITPAIDISTPQRKPHFRLDFNHGESLRNDQISRHSSTESFQMFSTSGESHRAKFTSSSESGGQQSLPTIQQSRADIDSSWDSSISSGDPRQHQSFESKAGHIIGDNGKPNDRPYSPPDLRLQEASMPSQGLIKNPATKKSGRISDAGSIQSIVPEIDEASQDILDVDYNSQLGDPSFTPAAIDPHLLVQRTIQFETQTGSLNAAIMILLLIPHLQPNTLDEYQAPAILRQYHQRLSTMMLFAEATLVRKLSYPKYPTVYGPAQATNGFIVDYYCLNCKKPLRNATVEVGRRLQRCERCQTDLEGCAVCFEKEAPAEYTVEGPATSATDILIDANCSNSRIWWWCQGCGHGGHTPCMRAWHSGPPLSEGSEFSGGACPVEGCLHPCLPGRWRDNVTMLKRNEKSAELSKAVKEVKNPGKGAVRRDSRDIRESRAVESVRGALVGQGGERLTERKKSVKVVAPGEE